MLLHERPGKAPHIRSVHTPVFRCRPLGLLPVVVYRLLELGVLLLQPSAGLDCVAHVLAPPARPFFLCDVLHVRPALHLLHRALRVFEQPLRFCHSLPDRRPLTVAQLTALQLLPLPLQPTLVHVQVVRFLLIASQDITRSIPFRRLAQQLPVRHAPLALGMLGVDICL